MKFSQSQRLSEVLGIIESQNHRFIEPFRLHKTFKIIDSNH